MKKIIIFYASYGGGHLSAAKSLEYYLKNNYENVSIELIDCMKYINKTVEKVTTTAYKEMAKKAPWAWGKLYSDSQKGPLAHISTRANSFMAIKLLHLLHQKNPDIIISTHPFGSQMCTYLKRKGKLSTKIATILTDFKSHDQWLIGAEQTDLFFVANDDMKNELLEKNIEEEKIHVTGIPIKHNFLIDYNRQEILDELKFSEDKKTVLFFGGGEFGLGKSMTLKVFECLIKNFPQIQIIAISGKNENMNNHFKKMVEENNRKNDVKIFEYTDKIAEFMSISTVVISKSGGLTSSESLACHVPMIIINPIPGQEEENADYLESKRVAKWQKKGDNVKYILDLLLNNDNILNSMKENTKLIAKPNAANDICKIIFS